MRHLGSSLLSLLLVAFGAHAQADPEAPVETSTNGVERLSDDADWGGFDDFATTASTEPGGTAPADQGLLGLGIELSINGFVEAALASRVVSDPFASDDFVLGEARGRLETAVAGGPAKGKMKLDFVGDGVTESAYLDLREIWADVAIGSFLNLRAGRQILTWGTADLLFLNDLFPKDFQSFFIGRDDEFLKAPSNALKMGWFMGGVGLDLVWTPIFEPDLFISGERLSFFFPPEEGRIGPTSDLTPIVPIRPNKEVENGEWATRLYGTVEGFELAAYGYLGFFKQPIAFDANTFTPTYARLGVYGASVRGLVLGGVFSLEGAFYHSYEDTSGNDPFIPNSQIRGLIGYELELLAKFTMGLQYYVEGTLAHDLLLENSPFPEFEPDALRHLMTLRLTYFAFSENLELSLFVFLSPSDVDAYLRPRIRYKVTEALSLVVGGNIMVGRDPFTFFGQLESNTNVYARMRFSF